MKKLESFYFFPFDFFTVYLLSDSALFFLSDFFLLHSFPVLPCTCSKAGCRCSVWIFPLSSIPAASLIFLSRLSGGGLARFNPRRFWLAARVTGRDFCFSAGAGSWICCQAAWLGVWSPFRAETFPAEFARTGARSGSVSSVRSQLLRTCFWSKFSCSRSWSVSIFFLPPAQACCFGLCPRVRSLC
jgi:hypothetical protein